jgi:hypothetical protein
VGFFFRVPARTGRSRVAAVIRKENANDQVRTYSVGC